MHPTSPATFGPSVRLAVDIVDELISQGVRHAVVCPGSRSAPVALALAEAERAGRLTLHVRTDERTAAFLALGLAKATGRVVPVAMTSGTAVANCLPAMVEATLSHVPLMVLSANRPLQLVGTGANQTIDQSDIFGVHSVFTACVEQTTARRVVREALQAAADPVTGGGVHVDVPLSEPLVPPSLDALSLLARESVGTASDSAGTTSSGRRGNSPGEAAVVARGDFRTLPHGTVTVDLSRRTVVIAGSAADEVWARETLEALSRVPTIAEPCSPAPEMPVHPAATAMFTAGAVAHGEYSAATRPEQIVVVGRPTLHRSVSKLLADETIEVTVLTDSSTVVDVTGNLAHVGSTVTLTGEHPAGWVDVCEAISSMGVEAVRQALATTAEFTGLHVAGVVADHLRDGDAVFLGASSAIRDAARVGLPLDGVRCLASRGAAGIDGSVSTAVGIAMAHAASDPTAMRAPRTIALLGDLTFLHDITGLNIGPLERRPENLLIVVANDSGGAIFEALEPGSGELRAFSDGTAAFERVFGTPLEVDLRSLCEAFGAHYLLAEDVAELSAIMEEHAEQPLGGITVVEARVSRAGRRDLEAKVTVKPS